MKTVKIEPIEYKNERLEVLLADGRFSLVNTDINNEDFRGYYDYWIWHICRAYELRCSAGRTSIIGLMSGREIAFEQCQYCDTRIPAGLISTWKLMNWDMIEEISENASRFGTLDDPLLEGTI